MENLEKQQSGFLATLTLKKTIIYIVLIIGSYTLILYAGLAILGKISGGESKNNIRLVQSKESLIAGSIGFNGLAPDGSTLAIAVRKQGDQDFTVVQSGLVPVDGATWNYASAEKGKTYEFQAWLQKDNKNIAVSSMLSVVAPAYNEILEINSSYSPSKTVKAAISGIFDLNGYLPSGSTLSLSIRKVGEANFKTVVDSLPAVDESVWSWNEALSGSSYELQGLLIQKGKIISQSQIQTLTAPANNEIIRINSTVQAPAGGLVVSSVSGKVSINGSIPNNSTLTINQRPTGTNNFMTVITGLPAADGAVWSWNQAASGTTYDFQAALITNGNVNAQSQILTVAAPAVNEILNINVSSQPPVPPVGSMANNCVGQNGSGQWRVQFTFNNNGVINNAKQFTLTVGNSSNDSSIINSTTLPSNPTQAQTYTSNYVFNSGQTYYAQWSYSTCTGCSLFSPMSPSLQFYCNPQAPTSTPTSTPTNTPIPTQTNTPTPLPTDTPTPTNTP